MITIENDQLIVKIAKHGAEIKSVMDKETETEYMWQANSDYWARTSPVLFPIVGKLTDDTYYVDGKEYTMTQHGFARDMTFECTKEEKTIACFNLKNSEETMRKYPFAFDLLICYKLEGNRVDVVWSVTNPSENTVLPFSIGAHPAFNLSLYDAIDPEDYYLEFNDEIELASKKLNTQGQFSGEEISYGKSDSLRIASELFVNDALVFSLNPIQTIALKNVRNERAVIMDVSKFEYKQTEPLLGIWSPYQDGGMAPFLCLEPWFGHADTMDGPFELSQKPGVITLEKLESFSTHYGLIFE